MVGQVMIFILIQTNYMNKTTFLTVALIVLLILNAVSLFILFHDHLGKNDHQLHNGEGPANYIIEQLKLDATQQKQFADLRREHQDFTRKFHDEDRKLHDAYFDLLKTDNPDKTKVDSIASLMSVQHKQLEQFTFEHFQKLRAICRDDQKKLFDETIDDISKMIGGGPPPPAGGPRGPGSPPH